MRGADRCLVRANRVRGRRTARDWWGRDAGGRVAQWSAPGLTWSGLGQGREDCRAGRDTTEVDEHPSHKPLWRVTGAWGRMKPGPQGEPM